MRTLKKQLPELKNLKKEKSNGFGKSFKGFTHVGTRFLQTSKYNEPYWGTVVEVFKHNKTGVLHFVLGDRRVSLGKKEVEVTFYKPRKKGFLSLTKAS